MVHDSTSNQVAKLTMPLQIVFSVQVRHPSLVVLWKPLVQLMKQLLDLKITDCVDQQ